MYVFMYEGREGRRKEGRKTHPHFLLELQLCLLVVELLKNLVFSLEVSGEVHLW